MQLHWGLITLVLTIAMSPRVQAQSDVSTSSSEPAATDVEKPSTPIPPEGLALLARIHEAYSSAPALQDTMHGVFDSPMGHQEGDYVLGFEGNELAVFSGDTNKFVARDGRVVVWFQIVENKYLEVPLVDDIMSTLESHMPDPGTLPFQMVFRYRDDPRRQLQSLGLGMVRGIGFDRIEPIAEGEHAGRVLMVLRGTNGTSEATVDPESGLIHRLVLATELGAQPLDYVVDLKPVVVPALTIPVAFDPAGRKRVTKWADLHTDVAQPPEVGEKMPDFDLASVGGGGRVRLSTLQGSVVVLQFFATWSNPCSPALDAAASVGKWISAERLNAHAFAIDIWEQSTDADEVRAALDAYWAKGGWDLHLLQASGTDLQTRAGITGLPLTLVLDQTGTVVFRHIGYSALLEENVKTAIEESLDDATTG